jgi:hypothetical protein
LIAFAGKKVYVFNTTTEDFDDITGAIVLSADIEHYSFVSMRDSFIFCSGLDSIYSTNGTEDIALFTADIKANILLPFGERLCGYNVVQDGSRHYQRLAWSTITDLTDFTGTGSGGIDLISQLGADRIMAAEILQDHAIIYGEEHIVAQYYVGGNRMFDVQPTVINKGAVGMNAVVAFPHQHIFMARDNIYSFTGAPRPDEVGEPIKRELYGSIDKEKWEIVFMEYREESAELVVHFPSKGSTVCDRYIALNMANKTFVQGTGNYTCGVRYRTVSAITIGELVGTIGQQLWRIGDALSGVNYPFTAYGLSSGEVHKYDENSLNDIDDAIEAYIDTKDFVADKPDTYLYFLVMLIEAAGHSLSIQYSTDEGASFTTLPTTIISMNYNVVWKDVEINKKKVRFRLRNFNVGEYFKLRRLVLEYQQGSNIL